MDYYISTSGFFPILSKKVKKIAIIHDFNYKLVPETMGRMHFLSHLLFFKKDVKSADFIICNSQGTANKLKNFFNKDTNEIINPPVSDIFYKRSIDEINHICKNTKLETECFIHGALCISYSGQSLFSSLIGGRSGNRGKCAGPCRLPYELLENDKKIDSGYLLNTRDLCGLEMIPSLLSARCNLFKNRRKNEIS